MPTLTIRGVPVKVVQVLKRRAKNERKSMEQLVREMLERQAADRAAVLDRVEELCRRQARPTTPEEVEAWKQEGRG